MTNKELEKRVEELERKFALLSKNNGNATIDGLEVGGKFVYKGHNYTKLNEGNFCIIDDCDTDFMRCIYDPISSDYDESIIRNYINSKRFIDKLDIDLEDLEDVYTDNKGNTDKLVLLTKDEYEEYRNLIDDFDYWWATRTAYNETTFCFVYYYGGCSNYGVSSAYCVRPGFILKPNTPIDRKGNDED